MFITRHRSTRDTHNANHTNRNNTMHVLCAVGGSDMLRDRHVSGSGEQRDLHPNGSGGSALHLPDTIGVALIPGTDPDSGEHWRGLELRRNMGRP